MLRNLATGQPYFAGIFSGYGCEGQTRSGFRTRFPDRLPAEYAVPPSSTKPYDML